MVIHSFRDVRHRFTHIDALFARSTFDGPAQTLSYTVLLYPWWEHPRYMAARAADEPWGFSDVEAGLKEVTVHASGVSEALLRCLDVHHNVIDWSFHEEHPLLWPYEDVGDLFCNGDLDPQAFLTALTARLPQCPDHWIGYLLARLTKYTPPFAFSYLPKTLHTAVSGTLTELGVPFTTPRTPSDRLLPVLFLLDTGEYIIAKDFELDVPEWEHQDEWFRPSSSGRAI